MTDTRLPLPVSSLWRRPQGRMALAMYLIIALVATFLNKLLVTRSEFKFPYPYCFTFFQLCLVEIALTTWRWGACKPQISSFRWNAAMARSVAPLTVVYTLVVIVSPWFLKHVEPTMYQPMRSLMVPMSMVLTPPLLHQNVHVRLYVACGFLCVGVWAASCDKLSLSWEGAFYGSLWAVLIALYGIIIKRTLAICRSDIWPLIHYNTLMSTVLIGCVVVISGELSDIYRHDTILDELGFWLELLVVTAADVSVQVAMLLLIKHTSPLTHAVAATTKTCFQVVLASLVFHNSVSTMQMMGLFLAFAGSACFYFYELHPRRSC